MRSVIWWFVVKRFAGYSELNNGNTIIMYSTTTSKTRGHVLRDLFISRWKTHYRDTTSRPPVISVLLLAACSSGAVQRSGPVWSPGVVQSGERTRPIARHRLMEIQQTMFRCRPFESLWHCRNEMDIALPHRCRVLMGSFLVAFSCTLPYACTHAPILSWCGCFTRLCIHCVTFCAPCKFKISWHSLDLPHVTFVWITHLFTI